MKILLNAAVAAITILPVTLHAEETKCPPQPERSCLYEDRIYTEGAKLSVLAVFDGGAIGLFDGFRSWGRS